MFTIEDNIDLYFNGVQVLSFGWTEDETCFFCFYNVSGDPQNIESWEDFPKKEFSIKMTGTAVVQHPNSSLNYNENFEIIFTKDQLIEVFTTGFTVPSNYQLLGLWDGNESSVNTTNISIEILYPPVPNILYWFTRESMLKKTEFFGDTVTLEDFAFVGGIVREGARVSPRAYSGLTDFEIFAITGQFFDLNTLNESDWSYPRTITLTDLRALFDPNYLDPKGEAPKIQITNFKDSKSFPLWKTSGLDEPFYPIKFNRDILGIENFHYLSMHLRPKDSYYNFYGSEEGSDFVDLQHHYHLGVKENVPFENQVYIERQHLVEESSGFFTGDIWDVSHGTNPSGLHLMTWTIFGVHFLSGQKASIAGPNLSGILVRIDLLSGGISYLQGSTTGLNTGFMQIKGGICQKKNDQVLAYSSDLETIKALAIATKTAWAI
jgi:hypothetical protein